MKVTHFLIYSVLFSLFSCTESLPISEDFIKNYYPKIQEAEKLIVEEKFDSALLKYEEVFKKVHYAQSKDLYNASICALKSKDYQTSTKKLELLFQRGMQLDLVSKTTAYNNVPAEIRDKIKRSYQQVRKSESFNFNKQARAYFQNLADLDQVYRVQGDYQNIEYLRKKVDSTDKIIIQDFLDFIREHGFPTDELIGIDGSPSNPIYSTILIHLFESNSANPRLVEFTAILKKAIKEGSINPDLALSYFGFSETKNSPSYGMPLLMQMSGDSNLRYWPVPKDVSDTIDNNRKKWGLASLEESREKIYSANKNEQLQDFLLDCLLCVMRFSSRDQNSIQYFKEKTETYSPS